MSSHILGDFKCLPGAEELRETAEAAGQARTSSRGARPYHAGGQVPEFFGVQVANRILVILPHL